MQPTALEKQAHSVAVDIVENHPEHHAVMGIGGMGWLAAVQAAAAIVYAIMTKLHDAGLFSPPPSE